MKAGLYVHIPFCLKKCRYCSFNSVPYNKKSAEAYLEALIEEIKACRYEVEPTSIYIGGGTPTVLPQGRLEDLLKALKEKFSPPDGVEATIEANPGTLKGLDIKSLLSLGINRVSLGAQSFNPAELKALGRLHGPDEVRLAVKALREAGVGDVGLDLMYSLPGQDMRSWKDSLEDAVGLGPEHLSLYDLSVEEGTEFYAEAKAGRLTLPPEPAQVEMYLMAVEMLGKAGFGRYEVSNFARPGHECRHNLNYWSCGCYVGFGAGAHSHISGTRSRNTEDVHRYADTLSSGASPVASVEALSHSEMEREYIMLGLRKADGIDLDEFRLRHGLGFMETYGHIAGRLVEGGYMDEDGVRIRLTLKGVLASNSVIKEFF